MKFKRIQKGIKKRFKGFTLIELLAIITILLIILLIAVPTVMKIINNIKLKAYENEAILIEKAAQTYIVDNSGNATWVNSMAQVTLTELVDSGLISSPVVNPLTGENFDETDTVVIVSQNSDNTYTYDLNIITPESCFGFDADTFTITDYYDEDDNCLPGVIVPNKINDIPVKNIGNGAFEKAHIDKIIFFANIINIGDDAFIHNNLTTIKLPGSLAVIGNSAFQHNNLIDLTIGNNVDTIENYAFSNNDIHTLIIGNHITSIGDYAFYVNNHLTTIYVPNNVINIGKYAFARSPLTAVTIDNTVSGITLGTQAFGKTNPTYLR